MLDGPATGGDEEDGVRAFLWTMFAFQVFSACLNFYGIVKPKPNPKHRTELQELQSSAIALAVNVALLAWILVLL